MDSLNLGKTSTVNNQKLIRKGSEIPFKKRLEITLINANKWQNKYIELQINITTKPKT